MVEMKAKNGKIITTFSANNNLWFDIKMHCAKNYRHFESLKIKIISLRII